jgi:hypothetical protein
MKKSEIEQLFKYKNLHRLPKDYTHLTQLVSLPPYLELEASHFDFEKSDSIYFTNLPKSDIRLSTGKLQLEALKEILLVSHSLNLNLSTIDTIAKEITFENVTCNSIILNQIKSPDITFHFENCDIGSLTMIGCPQIRFKATKSKIKSYRLEQISFKQIKTDAPLIIESDIDCTINLLNSSTSFCITSPYCTSITVKRILLMDDSESKNIIQVGTKNGGDSNPNIKLEDISNITSIENSFLRNLSIESSNKAGIKITNSSIQRIQTQTNNFPGIAIGKSIIDVFHAPAINFSNSVKIKNTTLNKLFAPNCQWNQTNIFHDVTFTNAPIVRGDHTSFSLNTIFSNCTFRDFSLDAVSSYRQLKNIFASQNAHDLEILFNSLELETIGKNTRFRENKVVWILDKLASFLNCYGRSLARPMQIWFLGTFLLGLIYYYVSPPKLNYINYQIPHIENYWGTWITTEDFFRSMFYALINSLGPLKLLPMLDVVFIENLWLKLLTFIQNIVSSVLIYMIITSIKKQFRHS